MLDSDQSCVPADPGRPSTGPLMWAQKAMWRALEASDDDSVFNLTGCWPMTDRPVPDRVLDALDLLVNRHETLRTTYAIVDGTPAQRVLPHSGISVDIVDGEHSATEAEALAADLGRARFDFLHELPLRVQMLCAGGRVRYVLIAVCHLALDAWSFELLRRELMTVVEHGASSLPPTSQPLARVAFEQSAQGQQLQSRTLDYWERCMRQAPAAMITPLNGISTETVERRGMVSPALAAGVKELEAAAGVGGSTIVLAATTLALAVACGCDTSFVRTITTTRFRRRDRHLLGAFNQEAPLYVDRTCDTFTNYAHVCVEAAHRAYRSCECDTDALGERVERVLAERRIAPGGYCFFNDVRFAWRGSAAAYESGDSEPHRLGEVMELPPKVEAGAMFFLTLAGLGTSAVLSLSKDRRFLPHISTTGFLRGIERIVLRAAQDTLGSPADLTADELFIAEGTSPEVRRDV
jgi:Condensation domain